MIAALAIIIIAAVVAWILLSRRKATAAARPTPAPDPSPFPVPPSPDPQDHTGFKQQHTPLGALVLSSTDRPSIPARALVLIDEGISLCINRMPASWVECRDHSDYILKFIDPMATNVETDPGSPALLVMVQGKDGMEQVQVAGYTVFGSESSMILPHQFSSDWSFEDYLRGSVWSESEHWTEHANDMNEFDRWLYVVGDSHPHRP
jgi:hypothetical protein